MGCREAKADRLVLAMGCPVSQASTRTTLMAMAVKTCEVLSWPIQNIDIGANEGADRLGQRAFDPGSLSVPVAPPVGFLQTSNLLQSFVQRARTQRDFSRVGFCPSAERSAGTGGACFTVKSDVDGVVAPIVVGRRPVTYLNQAGAAVAPARPPAFCARPAMSCVVITINPVRSGS